MKSKIIGAGILALLAAHGSAQTVPNDAATFSAQFADIVRRDAGTLPVTVKAPLVLSMDGMEIGLARLYAFCQAQAAKCGQATAEYAAGIVKVARDRHAPVDAANVRLVLRPEAYLAQVRERLSGAAATPLARPFIPGWVVMPVLDTPSATRPLDTRDLVTLKLDESALFKRGADNLAAALAPLDSVAKPVKTGQIGTLGGSIYDVSRVALHAQWAPLAAAQSGVLVIVLPTSDRVLYISEATPVARDALLALSRQAASQAPNAFAPGLLLRWTETGWVAVD